MLKPLAAGAPLRAFFLDGNAVRSVGVSRLANVETAFAMTVHKSQGSEFEHTVLVLPQEASQEAPARVGRLARIAGTVSYHPEGADRWEPALLNLPVSDGAAFWTEPGAEADIDIASARIVMDGGTELDIDAITLLAVNATLPQGHLYVRLRGLAAGESLTVLTPRGSVAMRADGLYGIVAGDTENPTRVAVLEGAAQVSGPNVTLDLRAGQTGVIEGQYDFAARVVPGQEDRFLTAQAERDRQAAAQVVPPASQPAAPRGVVQRQQRTRPAAAAPPSPIEAPPAVSAMPGGTELAGHGAWAETREHGRVWYPRAGTNWRPYRDGKWVWVRPWGWTWVDAAPWGFAPTHYGRWAMVRGRWAWVPGAATTRPVYTPAMMVFRGGTHGGGRPNIVLPPPTRDAVPVRAAAPGPSITGPILLRPLPGAPSGTPGRQVPLRPAIPSRPTAG